MYGGGISGDQDYMDPVAFPGIASIDRQGAPMLAGLVQDGAAGGFDHGSRQLESRGAGGGREHETGGDEHRAGGGHETGGELHVEQDREFPLRLVVKRELYYGGTLIAASSYLAPLRTKQRIVIHHADIPAGMDGLIGGDAGDAAMVTVVSRSGKIRLPLEVSDGVPSGSVVVHGDASPLVNIANVVNFVRLEK
jgi:hypothetical protein